MKSQCNSLYIDLLGKQLLAWDGVGMTAVGVFHALLNIVFPVLHIDGTSIEFVSS